MAKNPLRHQLLRLQRRNYSAKLRATQENFADPPYVARYGREYLAGVRGYERVATRTELVRKALKADVLYHGDYHTLRHSQRAILAVLQAVVDRRKLVLCLEMIHESDQYWLDRFQAQELEESEFLKRIRYHEKWAYNFNPWRAILEFCRDHQIKVLGINSSVPAGPHSLKLRDKASARIIAKALIREAPSLIYVVDGDYHIAPGHLPREVERLLAPLSVIPKKLLIYQNVEKLYWKLAAKGEEEAAVLKLKDDSYCLMNTVPATKLQSYLDWLEYAEDGYFPVKGQWAELWGDYFLNPIQSMVKDLGTLLNLELPKDALSHLTVYSSRNLDFADRVQQNPLLAPYWPRIREKLQREEGFLLEFGSGGHRRYWIYLPNASVNQAAEESSHLVHAILRGPIHPISDPLDAFYQVVMTEALGFFGSKLFNEKRKAPTAASLRRVLGKVRKGERVLSERDMRLATLILQHLHLEQHTQERERFRKKFSDLWPDQAGLAGAFATQLGYILGSKMFYASKRSLLNLGPIRALYFRTFDQPGEAFAAYQEWIGKLSHRLSTEVGPDLKSVSE
jgi:Haem-binding uptake, Tiki superfamily, ChaN